LLEIAALRPSLFPVGDLAYRELACSLAGFRTHERFEIGSYIGKNLLIGANVPRTFLNSIGAYRLKALVGVDLLDAARNASEPSVTDATDAFLPASPHYGTR